MVANMMASTRLIDGVSETARQKIEAAGGSVQLVAKPEAQAE